MTFKVHQLHDDLEPLRTGLLWCVTLNTQPSHLKLIWADSVAAVEHSGVLFLLVSFYFTPIEKTKMQKAESSYWTGPYTLTWFQQIQFTHCITQTCKQNVFTYLQCFMANCTKLIVVVEIIIIVLASWMTFALGVNVPKFCGLPGQSSVVGLNGLSVQVMFCLVVVSPL